MKLEAGKFYIDMDGFVWCCFEIDAGQGAHAQANCIRLRGKRIEYFFLDGRYEKTGESSNTLMREVPSSLIIKEDGSTRSIC